MVIYKRTRKELIIPTGFGSYSSDCEEAIEQAYKQGREDQEEFDRNRLGVLNLPDAGTFNAPFGYKQVNAYTRIVNPYFCFTFDGAAVASIPHLPAKVPMSLNGPIYYTYQTGRALGSNPQLWFEFYTAKSYLNTLTITAIWDLQPEVVFNHTPIKIEMGQMLSDNNIDLTDQVTITTEAEAGRTTWRITANHQYEIFIPDWESYVAGLGVPQVNDAIVVQNDLQPFPYGAWAPSTGRDLLLDGVPYSATTDGTFYGTMCQFNVGPDNVPSTTPSSITFTLDCKRTIWESVVGGVDVSMLAIFGQHIDSFTQTKVITTPQLDPNIYIGVTYTLIINDNNNNQ